MKKTCVLLVLDGWGVGKSSGSNPIYVAKPETVEYLKQNYASAALQANGVAVGLPWGEEGNSRVGHLTIGAGRIVYQNFPRIGMAIKDRSFFKNEALLKVIDSAKESGGYLQVLGLLSERNVHSSLEHYEALLNLCRQENFKRVSFHLFADGKDSDPKSVGSLLERLKKMMGEGGELKLSSVIGRYYAMDSHGNWDRTEKAYRLLTQGKESTEDFDVFLDSFYKKGRNDDFLGPYSFEGGRSVQAEDSVLFMNFREDSIRQLAASFALKDFPHFERSQGPELIATLSEYSPMFDKVLVAFKEKEVLNPLGQVLSEADKAQMLVAETIHYASVSYFFNGLRDTNFPGQLFASIPSSKLANQAQKPEMKAEDIANRVIQGVDESSYDFILANFANAGVVAQSGNFQATVEAVKAVDAQLERIVKACEASGTTLIITGSHGNAEQVVNPVTGAIETKADPDPVPLYLVGKEFKVAEARAREGEVIGMLSDLAPTILEILEIEKPKEMTGKSLLRYLKTG